MEGAMWGLGGGGAAWRVTQWGALQSRVGTLTGRQRAQLYVRKWASGRGRGASGALRGHETDLCPCVPQK